MRRAGEGKFRKLEFSDSERFIFYCASSNVDTYVGTARKSAINRGRPLQGAAFCMLPERNILRTAGKITEENV